MTAEVMSGIWSNGLDYTSYVGKAHWMDSAYLLPVIAYKYKLSKIVVFNNSGTDTQHVDRGVVLLPMFIVMMKSNAVLQPKLCLDWFTTFVV